MIKQSVMHSVAFLESSPGQFWVGWGPFSEQPVRPRGRMAFYIPDYFLDNPYPWKCPIFWESLSTTEFLSRLALSPQIDCPKIQWSDLNSQIYWDIFASAQEAIQAGAFQKIVPVFFEEGRCAAGGERLGTYALWRLLQAVPSQSYRYGWIHEEGGVVGVTPETLFVRTPSEAHLSSMALAGTRRLSCAEELLTDPKERREHEFVVEDLQERLKPWGKLEVTQAELVRYPTVAHLRTRVQLQLSERGRERSFEDWVHDLHPTAALGAWPRTGWGTAWLRALNDCPEAGWRGQGRGCFGAPFGYAGADETSHDMCVVGIRQLQWTSAGELCVGAGSGVLGESRCEQEWKELAQKRAQVKVFLGLESPRA